jgi:hypothetical protein
LQQSIELRTNFLLGEIFRHELFVQRSLFLA